tara:strand:+ start:153 stop:1238 length:1086 start_codon:yes stop_codon:yes gene_type:complete
VKICFDNEVFWQQKFSGVASRYYFNLIKYLHYNEDIDLKVFASIYLNEKIEKLPKKILSGYRLKNRIPYTGKIFEQLNSVICKYQIKKFIPDIIHKTYYSNNLEKLNSKIILTVFDLWHEKNSDYKYMPKKYALNIADHILCPSQKTKKDLIEIYNVEKEKVTVTYFGIENFTNNQTSSDYDNLKKRYLLFVGSRGRYKNFINFIKAFSKSDMLKKDFFIICFGGGSFLSYEKKLFDELKISNRIIKSENDNDETLYNLYLKAYCLVYPSSHEGLGLPPLEAMSLGCPVISSNHEAILEGVGNASALFDPFDIDEIKSQLESTLYSKEKIDELIKNGNLQAKKFSWEKCAKETLEVYKKFK